MTVVHQQLDSFPYDRPPLVLERDEKLLLAEPLPIRARALREHGPLEAVHISPEYVEQGRTHPKGLYQNDLLRLEVQTMNGRQGFYHRNADVDEVSFQVCGERTLITEYGTVTHRPGDFSRIPLGVAHDNLGKGDIHLLFYSPGPLQERLPASRTAQYLRTPFPGWEPAVQNEMITEMRGGSGEGIHVAPADERLLLDRALRTDARIALLTPAQTAWIYASDQVLIGTVMGERADGSVYTCHLDADEIQYQVSGTRTLISQRGLLDLEPGDFVRIPRGVSFTGRHDGPSTHLAIAVTQAVPQVAESAKQAHG